MKHATSIWDRLSLGLAASAFVATALLYSHLPDPMPVHFDGRGEVNGYMPRWLGAWFPFALGAGLTGLLRFGHRWLPERFRGRMASSPMAVVTFIVIALLAALQGVVLYAGVAAPPNVGRLLALSMAIFTLMFGLVMPRIRRNAFAGVRTPWTMKSDEVWARTHRFGGHVMVAAALVGFLGAAIGSLPLTIAALVAGALIPVPYSYLVSRRLGV